MNRFESAYKPIKKYLAPGLLGIAALLYGSSPAWAQGSIPLEDFAVLAGEAVTCTDSVVNGDVGVVDAGTVTQTNCTILGTVDLDAQQAYDDFLDAYDDLAGVTCDFVLGSTIPVSETLPPGVYCTDAALTATDVVLTLDGSSDDTWTFIIGTSGTGALTGTRFAVVLASGETCSNNVTWWTAQVATLTDSVFLGSILAGTDITNTGGSLDGQALAGGTGTSSAPTGAVTLTGADISVCDGGTPAPPGQGVPIKVTGGGQIQVPNPDSTGRASFGFNAQPDKSGGAKGHFNYVNHETGLHVNGPVTDIRVIAINDDGSPKTIRFSGTCANSPECLFRVTVEDHGEPGSSDEFGISVFGELSEITSQRVISRGNIQFHTRPAAR
ncbi:MAG: ice-binding family protein [Halothiobacillus sp.]|jgi:hypothetical protein|nr:ice-binding family protein [Halothiobacillus sp.]